MLDVSPSGDYEDRRANAKLAISIARKMNALIFLVPEDIVDVRPRLVSFLCLVDVRGEVLTRW